jgi:TrmH family RNA methyltransferase
VSQPLGHPEITSPSNPRLRDAAALRNRGGREASGRLLVDGAREVVRALDGGVVFTEAFVVDPMPPDVELAAAAGRLAAAGIACVTVSPGAIRRVAYGDRASGIVAVVEAPTVDLARLVPVLDGVRAAGRAPLVAVVEDVEKPGNLGAVARSADGAGCDALVAATGTAPPADPWNPNAVRASLGTLFTLPVAVAPTADVIAFLVAQGLRIVVARVDGSAPYTETDLSGPTALVLGSEARGLTGAWSGPEVRAVRLPMLGHADSLNVSAAAAILFYEARRQRDAAARS